MSIQPFFRMLAVALAIIGLAANRGQTAAAAEKLVVHEWGTFTSLQDENGRQLGGINVDDEPVPSFVYGDKGEFLSQLHPQFSIAPQVVSKGAPQRNPLVTMRLETPVMYFYLPKSQQSPLVLNVNVDFHGGWLTQFYPFANADAPGYSDRSVSEKLDRNTVTRLTWNSLRVGTHAKGPETTKAVWLTPRNVAADSVTAANGESEKYLFYRGVANLESPLAVSTDRSTGELTIRSCMNEVLDEGHSQKIRWLWLVHIRPDGSIAYRELKPFEATADRSAVAASKNSKFDESDYSRDNLAHLQQSMHAALIERGTVRRRSHRDAANVAKIIFRQRRTAVVLHCAALVGRASFAAHDFPARRNHARDDGPHRVDRARAARSAQAPGGHWAQRSEMGSEIR